MYVRKPLPHWVVKANADLDARMEALRTGGPKTLSELTQWFCESEQKRDELTLYAANNPKVMELLLEAKNGLEKMSKDYETKAAKSVTEQMWYSTSAPKIVHASLACDILRDTAKRAGAVICPATRALPTKDFGIQTCTACVSTALVKTEPKAEPVKPAKLENEREFNALVMCNAVPNVDYHWTGCKFQSSSAVQATVREALDQGHVPCHHCEPPTAGVVFSWYSWKELELVHKTKRCKVLRKRAEFMHNGVETYIVTAIRDVGEWVKMCDQC